MNPKFRTARFPTAEGQQSLAEVRFNTEVKVVEIRAGMRARQRLSGMGITIGSKVKVLSQAPFRGPIQIEVRGTRLALGQGLTRKIIVSKN